MEDEEIIKIAERLGFEYGTERNALQEPCYFVTREELIAFARQCREGQE